MNPPPLRYKFMHYITIVDSYKVDSYERSTIPSTMLTLYINCGITLVMMNNGVCPNHLSMMPEATCSIERLIPCASMIEVIETVACLICMSHMF